MTTTYRELLERAAKAADVFLTPEKLAEVFPEWDWCETDEPYFTEHGAMVGTVVWYGSDGVELGGTEKLEWDPLHDDGDALRLAVKLGLVVSVDYKLGLVFCTSIDRETYQAGEGLGDPYAATRRAIVRAAAAMAGGDEA